MKTIKIKVKENQFERIKQLKLKLKKRGLSKEGLSLVFSLIFQKALDKLGDEFFREVLNELTPISYKIECLSQNEDNKRKLLDMVEQMEKEL